MEVHPPEGGIHSWRDFFIHMGTICLGLLIALGLEQVAVAVHEAHQRAELRVALDADSHQDLLDSRRSEAAVEGSIVWAVSRANQVRAALASNTALALRRRPPVLDMDIIDDAAFKAAKASSLLALLPQADVLAYSEEDGIVGVATSSYNDWQTTRRNLSAFELAFYTPDGRYDFSTATQADLHRYLDLLTDSVMAAIAFRFWNEQDRGLETALLRGERDLNKLHKSERTFTTSTAPLLRGAARRAMHRSLPAGDAKISVVVRP